jgi:hypothetical protein
MTVLRNCTTKRGIVDGAERAAGVCVRRAEPAARFCRMCDIRFFLHVRVTIRVNQIC